LSRRMRPACLEAASRYSISAYADRLEAIVLKHLARKPA